MSEYKYNALVKKAKEINTAVKKEYKKPSGAWGYYFAKSILKPKKAIPKITIKAAEQSTGDNFGRQIYKSTYDNMAERLVKYVESHNQLPNNISVSDKLMRVSDYTYMFSRILAYYDEHGAYPKYANVNSKAFTKPTENTDSVYDYFVKVFGKVTCIDDAMEKIAGRGYGYYYDEVYSNKQSIDRVKSKLGINCTDATQMMKHVADGTGKYKKIDCVHVKCRGGDGHVYLKITNKDGSVFYRDPAACLDNGNINSIWCSNGTILAINPSWWTANLNK